MINRKTLEDDLRRDGFGVSRWETKDDECLMFILHLIKGMNPELLDIIIYDWNKRSK